MEGEPCRFLSSEDWEKFKKTQYVGLFSNDVIRGKSLWK